MTVTYAPGSSNYNTSGGGGGGGAADEITFTPAGNLAAEDVQAALEELDSEKAAASHSHAASDITSGTFDDARISESSVTQHADAVVAAASAIDADTVDGYSASDLATINAPTGVSADLGSSAGYLLASSAPVNSPPLTLGCWIRLSTVSSTSTPVCIKSDDNSKLLQIYFFGGSQSITVQITDNGGGSSTFLQATSLGWSADEWHHIGFRWEADNTVSLWIDGTEADSDTSTKDISASTSIRFGGNTAGSSSFYGLLSHPFVAAQALSDAAMLAIGTGAVPSEYLSASTDYYWPDLSGAGPHASSLATLSLAESGTVGDAASDPTVVSVTPLAHTHPFSAITGTGNLDDLAALTDPGADRLLFWDDSAGAYTHLTLGSGLTITDTTIAVGSLNASAITAGTLDSARLPTLGEPITGVSATKSGGSSYLEMASPLADMSTFTVALWFKPHVGSQGTAFNQENTSDGKGFSLDYGWPSSTSYRVLWRGSGSWFGVIQSASVIDDEWQHLAVTYGSGTWRLYVDGVEVGSQAYAGVPSGNVLRLFSGGDGTTGDDVAHPAVWSGTALSAGQIAELAAGASPAVYSPTRYYRDISGSGPHSPTVGSGDLSESGSIGDAADDPNVIAPFITEPADGSITFAKLQPVSANVLLGNDASGTTVEEIACTAAGRALLDDADAAAQRTTLGLDPFAAIKTNLSASAAPGTGDDSADGYSVGSIWIDTTADVVYICADASEGAAVWKQISGGGGERMIQFAGQPLTTACPALEILGSTAKYEAWAFDDTTEEYLYDQLQVPNNVDADGTVTFTAYVMAKTAAASKNVALTFGHRPLGDSEAVDGAYTDEDTGDVAIDATQGDQTKITWTESVANLGWAAGDQLLCRLSRYAAGANNLSGDMYLIGFSIRIPTE